MSQIDAYKLLLSHGLLITTAARTVYTIAWDASINMYRVFSFDGTYDECTSDPIFAMMMVLSHSGVSPEQLLWDLSKSS